MAESADKPAADRAPAWRTTSQLNADVTWRRNARPVSQRQTEQVETRRWDFSSNSSRNTTDFLLEARWLCMRRTSSKRLLFSNQREVWGVQLRAALLIQSEPCQTRTQGDSVLLRSPLYNALVVSFYYETQTPAWTWLLPAFTGVFFGRQAVHKPHFEPCFTSSWSPSRTFWDRDPFGEGSWTQEL